MIPARDQHDLEAITVLQQEAGLIDDPDPRSQSERTINRTWAALRRAGDRRLFEVEDRVRQNLASMWPELRIEALTVLCRWGRTDAIEDARRIASDEQVEATERAYALGALVASPRAGDPEIRRLISELVDSDSAAVARAARSAQQD